jgi:2-octaprenyl-6-methoxyphenol hydroxylase
MTIRDIKQLSDIIQGKIDLGIQLDNDILKEFQKKIKNKNFIFSTGINLIYEFFNIEKNFKEKRLIQILKFIGTNKNFKNLFIKFADKGLNI